MLGDDSRSAKDHRAHQMFPLLATHHPAGLLLWFLLGFMVLPELRYALPLFLDSAKLATLLNDLGPWASILFVGLHIIATMLGVPGVILTMVGGICFGVLWGTLWSLIGATLGAIAAFGMARYFMHGWCDRHFGRHPLLKFLNRMVADRPFWVVMTVRFAPISPFNLMNFLFGLTRMSALPYAMGTLIGIVPGVFVYTWFGRAGYQSLHGQGLTSLILAGVTLGVLSAIPLVLRRQPIKV